MITHSGKKNARTIEGNRINTVDNMAKKDNKKTNSRKNKPDLVSYGDFVLPPVIPGVEVEELCKRIDAFYSNYSKQHKKKKASDLIKGAFFSMRSECRSNPDWMSQAANSARDVLYPLFSEGISGNNLIKLFRKYAVSKDNNHNIKNNDFINTFNNLDVIYKKLSDLTHHGTDLKGFSSKQFSDFSEKDFENLMRDFTIILGRSFGLQQIYVHAIIDLIILKEKKTKGLLNDLKLILKVNSDAHYYFYSKVDVSWLNCLWQKGFLNVIKKSAEDSTRYSYRLPELDYLTRAAVKKPAMVTKIMLDKETATKEGKLNPEVIDRFLWIISTLPPEQIEILTTKMRDEKWVYLMRAFHKTGYEFEKIVKKLIEGKESDAILELAEAILIVKSKVEIKEKGINLSVESPFYVSDIDASEIFEALIDIEDSHKEKALKITTGVMGEVVKLAELDETKVFNYVDLLSLYEVDFFTLEIEDKRSYSYREDVKNIAATIKKLIEKTIGGKCGNVNEAKRLLGHIDKLPSCRSMWRLRLFALTQCPEVFKEELKEAFFKLFSVENYYEIEGGTEYKKALKIGFSYLSDTDQCDYVKNVLSYFFEKSKKNPDKVWIKRTGWEIMSSIPQELLKEEDKVNCGKYFGRKPDQKYEPEPSMKMGEAGVVKHKSPVNLDDYTIDEIIANLKSEWTAEKLNEQFKNDDFLSPRGVEGLGDALKENIKKRTGDYLLKINSFFDRDLIHPHYLYSLLRGIEELLRSKQLLSLEQTGQILGLFEIIRISGSDPRNPFKRGDDKSWLVDWIEVHTVITDILLSILENKETKEKIHKVYRQQIINMISYLFTIKDSPSKKNETPESNDPYHAAINSVRGRAYEAFVVFTENDGKKLADDVKEIYKKVLLDDSLAVRFVVGRYLPTFYFRNKEFVLGLLSDIFPKDIPERKDLYLASWEGYLSNTLYDKLFVELKDYYSHAISLNPKDYTQRKYSKELDESLAIHVALAFAHLGLETEDQLFVQFWNTPNVKRHQEFISFIGRSCLTRDQTSDQWLLDNKVSKEKLLMFWDWALEYVTEKEALGGFGFWVNPNNEVLDEDMVIEKMAQTLEKSDGGIDWDYGLLRRLPIFAEKNSDKTFEIIKHFLLDSQNNLNQNRRVPLLYEKEIEEALKIIYKNGNSAIQQKVTDLVNILLEKGSRMFWSFKKVLE